MKTVRIRSTNERAKIIQDGPELAVVQIGNQYSLLHKRTRLRFLRFSRLLAATTAQDALADLNWQFGHNWGDRYIEQGRHYQNPRIVILRVEIRDRGYDLSRA